MSSEDVIELGSSDEEPEPAPKRSKPTPNAMVCIPRKLHDVTIKPAKPSLSSITKGLGKAITVKKVQNLSKLPVIKNKFNGRPVPSLKPKIAMNPFSGIQKPILIPNKVSNSKATFSKSVCKTKAPVLQNPIRIQNSKSLNLPSSITVKKTNTNRPIVLLNVKKKECLTRKNVLAVGDVLTVELDDDEVSTENSSPQWYLRPEEQKDSLITEEDNNKEPDASKLIEITIEDSPVKLVHNNKTHELGTKFAITIEDSPVKVVADENINKSGSDGEGDKCSGSSTPHSKKKLEYPKEADSNKTLEIEIDPVIITDNKQVVESQISIPKKCDALSTKELKTDVSGDQSEFHPVYRDFINLCFQLENSDDMKKIVEKKIIGYYRQVPKEYTESEEFTDMVSSKMISMKAAPEKMYLFIKDVVDELNLQRKLAKSQPVIKETKNEEPAETHVEEYEYDSKRQRQIRKLEKTIKKLHRAIQKLEEQEVDFDDEDDSVYLLTERYKERMVRVYAKFCQLSNTKMPSEPRIQLDPRPGQPSGPAKRLEKWINKKVPIGTPLPFPDFHDVLRCVREANDEDKLGFNEVDIMEEARDLFTRCGRKLQRRRQENEWRLAASRITLDIDPAENNDELKRKLTENKKVAAHRETEIFNKYADRQNQLKLEAEEIGDKEAEESPVESEEEGPNDESVDDTLENTEKRKERLKRLLQEKSKKSEEKENQPMNEDSKTENSVVKFEADVEAESTTKTETVVESETQEKINTEETTELSKKDETGQNITETLSLSDDSSELESDIDELHLLQKLRSPNGGRSSTVDTSGSESPIAISDSLKSSDEDNNEINEDVISIENSSYSENEDFKTEKYQELNTDSVQFINDSSPSQDADQFINKDSTSNQNVETNESALPDGDAMEVEYNNSVIQQAPTQTNNDEYADSVENILLASSEDENCDSQEEAQSPCVNLRDDIISIDETVIGSINIETELEEEKIDSVNVGSESDKTCIVKVNVDINVAPSNEQPKEKTKESTIDSNQGTNQSNEVKTNDSIEEMDVDQGENSDKISPPEENNTIEMASSEKT